MTKKTALRMETIHNKNTVVKDRALTAFKHYTSAFDQSNIQIANKIRHTWHVAENSERIAAALECNAELAWLIGVLHDIGRFEQIRVVHGYDDSKGIDHGDYGESLLFGEGKIRAFIADDSADEIIRKAVKYHNKYGLPDGLSNKELIYCNIIRDADKIDILRVNCETPRTEIYDLPPEAFTDSQITEAVYEDIMSGRNVDRRNSSTGIDYILGHIGFVYGLVFPESLRMVEEQGYLDELLSFRSRQPETARKMGLIRRKIKEYVQVNL
jgi:putative nucleotidyltransferase with HDIG domain